MAQRLKMDTVYWACRSGGMQLSPTHWDFEVRSIFPPSQGAALTCLTLSTLTCQDQHSSSTEILERWFWHRVITLWIALLQTDTDATVRKSKTKKIKRVVNVYLDCFILKKTNDVYGCPLYKWCRFFKTKPSLGSKRFSNLKLFDADTQCTQRKATKMMQEIKRVSKTSVVCIMWMSRLPLCAEMMIIVICAGDLLGHDNSATAVWLRIISLIEQTMWALFFHSWQKKITHLPNGFRQQPFGPANLPSLWK